MDVPDDRVSAYLTTVDVFLEADSEDEAIDALEALAGTEVSLDGRRVFVEESYAVEGDPIDPASFEGEGLPLYPGEAVIAVLADSLDDAELVFRSLNGSSMLDAEGREVSFDLTDAPVEEGMIPTPPFEASATKVSFSAAAHRFAWERGGSVYVWGESFGGGFVSLTVAMSPPLRPELERHSEVELDGRTVTVHLEEGLAPNLAIRLRRFPRAKLVVYRLEAF